MGNVSPRRQRLNVLAQQPTPPNGTLFQGFEWYVDNKEIIGNVLPEISPSSKKWESLQSGSLPLPKAVTAWTLATGFTVCPAICSVVNYGSFDPFRDRRS